MDWLKLVLIVAILVGAGLRISDLASYLAQINAESGGIYFKVWLSSTAIWVALSFVESATGKRTIIRLIKGAAVLASYASLLQMNVKSLINATMFNFGIYTIMTGIGTTITTTMDIARDRSKIRKVPAATWLIVTLNIAIMLSAIPGLIHDAGEIPLLAKVYISITAIVSLALITDWPEVLTNSIRRWCACVDSSPNRNAGTGILGIIIFVPVINMLARFKFPALPIWAFVILTSIYIVWMATKEIKECSTFKGYATRNTGQHIAEIVAAAEREKIREGQ